MTKIIALTIVALALIGLVAGGTLAYFTDTEKTVGNVFTAGTIDLAVNDENPWTTGLCADLTDLKPCMTDNATIKLSNVGTNPMQIWMKVDNVTTSGGATTYHGIVTSEPELVAENQTGTWTPIDNVDTVISLAMTLGTLNVDYGTLNFNAIKDKWIYLGTLNAGDSWTGGSLSVKFACDAGNEYQGDTMSFNIEFFAQQSEGSPLYRPGDELAGYTSGLPAKP